ncbi:ribosomal protein S5 domain 2-type protein [Kockovaella imperatae]|uniref:Ribosomal RNA-processing protein 43 n=1 Tax=Kockovaella imperatae TaxID=4999 RepID=A0A1Y1UT67_9TREE|nr:ribosomal protein S5 domain 2-type protein [Kockovaella imperatae]ORX41213.1 ribosomal protein S5 domain 2-type protein [Kockovaella imperatae]
MTVSEATASAQDMEVDSSSKAESSATAFKRLHPGPYLSKFLAKGYRPDGRKVTAWRDVKINKGSVSTADGSALVRLGDTTMVCGVKAEIAEPLATSPRSGYIVPNIDLPALCSPKFKPGPPADEAQTMSNWLFDLITSSRTVDPQSLCICPGKAVWALYIDVVCINYDGNAFDAAVLAVMAALGNTRLRSATYDDITAKVTCSDDFHSLALGRLPLSCSFGIFKSAYLLPDPSSFEAPLIHTTLTIALDEENRACLVRHEGLGGTDTKSGQDVLDEAWSIAEERVREIRRLLDDHPATNR